MTRITINGDDFGMNLSCTRAIVRALREGLITDTTMMANGAYFDEAVRTAKEFGMTDRIGVHLNLTEGQPLTGEIAEIPLLVHDGCFYKDYLRAPRELNERERMAVKKELSAQIERILDSGLIITHADSHHYIHTYAMFAPIVAEVCQQYGINTIRLNRTIDTPDHPIIREDRVDNRFWQEQGFLTAVHFGRLADLFETEIPDRTEILVHPDFDRDGRLIDRTSVIDGYPSGDVLDGRIIREKELVLCRYSDLVS